MFDTKKTVGRWPSILAAIGVDDKTLSKRNCPCPFCGGKDRFRFTDHESVGTWVCNVCGSGNGFHFVQRWENTDFKGACAVIERILPQAYIAKTYAKRDNRAALNRTWNESFALPGSPAERYLAARGIFVLSSEIRSHQSLPYYIEGKRASSYAAMVSRVRDGTGRPTTLHVTYLARNGDVWGKARVPSEKKVMSTMGDGAHVRLFPAAGDTLCLTEGIETGLAVYQRTGLPTWSMISAAGLTKFVRPEHVKRVEIWGDNDASFTGQSHAFALAYRLRQQDECDVAVHICPTEGEDWADEACRNVGTAV